MPLTYAGNVHNCPDGAMGSGAYDFGTEMCGTAN